MCQHGYSGFVHEEKKYSGRVLVVEITCYDSEFDEKYEVLVNNSLFRGRLKHFQHFGVELETDCFYPQIVIKQLPNNCLITFYFTSSQELIDNLGF